MKPYYDHAGITIYHGDCRDVLMAIDFDVVVTDPPYGVGIDYGDGTDDTTDTSGALLLDVLRISVPKAKRVLTTVGLFETEKRLYREMPPRWRLCWRKGITSRPSPVGFTDWEPVFVYGHDVHRHAHDLFTAQPEKMGRHGHPCPKPLAFAAWILARFSDTSDVVVDPFMGSGTTLRAAKDLGRKAIGIEIEEKYCEIAANRLSQEVLFGST
jgi:site-specific DNA-methyltransferase (adenine-specific)